MGSGVATSEPTPATVASVKVKVTAGEKSSRTINHAGGVHGKVLSLGISVARLVFVFAAFDGDARLLLGGRGRGFVPSGESRERHHDFCGLQIVHNCFRVKEYLTIHRG